MSVTRRQFMAGAAGAAAMGLAFARCHARQMLSSHTAEAQCGLLDLGAGCGLRESLAGFEAALGTMNVAFTRIEPRSAHCCHMSIVPGAVAMDASLAAELRSGLDSGATVLLEWCAGFAGRGDFEAQQAMLRAHFGVTVQPPVHLWASEAQRPRVPYVDFTWPLAAKIRDFSYVLPLACQEGEAIGWSDELPMALKRRVGKGTLIFLGSPLGPALWAGDREAHRWLGEVLVGV